MYCTNKFSGCEPMLNQATNYLKAATHYYFKIDQCFNGDGEEEEL